MRTFTFVKIQTRQTPRLGEKHYQAGRSSSRMKTFYVSLSRRWASNLSRRQSASRHDTLKIQFTDALEAPSHLPIAN